MSTAAAQENVRSWVTNISKKGEYVRKDSSFRDFVTADGSSGFKAERDRYHLYIAYACPWAHRALLVRKLKGLEDVISFDVVDWLMLEKGWKFNEKRPGCTPDTVNNCQSMREIYKLVVPDYDGTVSVPVLWDKQKKTIVNNESSEIIRMLNSEFNEFCAFETQHKLDLYPEELRKEIDEVNSWIYPNINNGVYRCGFSRKQESYDEVVVPLFDSLDRVEKILSTHRYLAGNTLTEADIRLFVTLIRFDLVYVGHFKCNKKRIVDYPNIWGYVREIYQMPGVSDTFNKEHTMKHYMMSHLPINPFGIVSIGPDIDFNSPHERDKM